MRWPYIASLVCLLGAALLLFLNVLCGASTSSVLGDWYWLEADTSSIPGAPKLTRWTNYAACGVSNDKNTNCTSKHAAYPMSPVSNFGTTEGVPSKLSKAHGSTYFLSKCGYAFLLVGLFFTLVTLLPVAISFCAPKITVLNVVSSFAANAALFFTALSAALLTAAYIKARNAFRDAGKSTDVGTTMFAFIWTSVLLLILSSILSGVGCLGNYMNKRKEKKASENYGSAYDHRSSNDTYANNTYGEKPKKSSKGGFFSRMKKSKVPDEENQDATSYYKGNQYNANAGTTYANDRSLDTSNNANEDNSRYGFKSVAGTAAAAGTTGALMKSKQPKEATTGGPTTTATPNDNKYSQTTAYPAYGTSSKKAEVPYPKEEHEMQDMTLEQPSGSYEPAAYEPGYGANPQSESNSDYAYDKSYANQGQNDNSGGLGYAVAGAGVGAGTAGYAYGNQKNSRDRGVAFGDTIPEVSETGTESYGHDQSAYGSNSQSAYGHDQSAYSNTQPAYGYNQTNYPSYSKSFNEYTPEDNTHATDSYGHDQSGDSTVEANGTTTRDLETAETQQSSNKGLWSTAAAALGFGGVAATSNTASNKENTEAVVTESEYPATSSKTETNNGKALAAQETELKNEKAAIAETAATVATTAGLGQGVVDSSVVAKKAQATPATLNEDEFTTYNNETYEPVDPSSVQGKSAGGAYEPTEYYSKNIGQTASPNKVDSPIDAKTGAAALAATAGLGAVGASKAESGNETDYAKGPINTTTENNDTTKLGAPVPPTNEDPSNKEKVYTAPPNYAQTSNVPGDMKTAEGEAENDSTGKLKSSKPYYIYNAPQSKDVDYASSAVDERDSTPYELTSSDLGEKSTTKVEQPKSTSRSKLAAGAGTGVAAAGIYSGLADFKSSPEKSQSLKAAQETAAYDGSHSTPYDYTESELGDKAQTKVDKSALSAATTTTTTDGSEQQKSASNDLASTASSSKKSGGFFSVFTGGKSSPSVEESSDEQLKSTESPPFQSELNTNPASSNLGAGIATGAAYGSTSQTHASNTETSEPTASLYDDKELEEKSTEQKTTLPSAVESGLSAIGAYGILSQFAKHDGAEDTSKPVYTDKAGVSEASTVPGAFANDKSAKSTSSFNSSETHHSTLDPKAHAMSTGSATAPFSVPRSSGSEEYANGEFTHRNSSVSDDATITSRQRKASTATTKSNPSITERFTAAVGTVAAAAGLGGLASSSGDAQKGEIEKETSNNSSTKRYATLDPTEGPVTSQSEASPNYASRNHADSSTASLDPPVEIKSTAVSSKKFNSKKRTKSTESKKVSKSVAEDPLLLKSSNPFIKDDSRSKRMSTTSSQYESSIYETTNEASDAEFDTAPAYIPDSPSSIPYTQPGDNNSKYTASKPGIVGRDSFEYVAANPRSTQDLNDLEVKQADTGFVNNVIQKAKNII